MSVEFKSMDLDYVVEIPVDPWFAKIKKEGLFCKEWSVVLGMMVLITTMKIVEKSSMQNLQMSIKMLNSSKDIVWYDFHFFPNELGID